MPKKSSSKVDIFGLLTDTAEKKKKKRREELLKPLGVKEFFVEGSIDIDKKTCHGVECKICIEKCPTNALYWKAGEVGIVKDLCVYCGACVLCCMVDDCIKVARKRETGEEERFSRPRDVAILIQNINAKRRLERIQEVFPTPEEYCRRYRKKKKPMHKRD